MSFITDPIELKIANNNVKTLSFVTAAAALVATALLAAPAVASCRGEGYARYCDGYGGPGASYSERGSNGRTTYYNQDNNSSRTQEYRSTGSGSYINTYRNY
jgi:hypothetical protein